jgi:hypothetical protein
MKFKRYWFSDEIHCFLDVGNVQILKDIFGEGKSDGR